MEVSGDIHASATLPPGSSPRYARGGPQRRSWPIGKDKYGTLTFLSLVLCLSVCLSAFILCLFCLVFHVSFPLIFPVFVSYFYLILSFFIFCYFLFSHIFCINSFLLPFLSFHDNQGCLFYISWLEVFGTTQSLHSVLEDLSGLKHIRRPYPNVIDIVAWHLHYKAPEAHGLGWRGEIRDGRSLS